MVAVKQEHVGDPGLDRLPDEFYGVELRRIGRQENQDDVHHIGSESDGIGTMDGSVVEDHHDLPVSVRLANGIQEGTHVRGLRTIRDVDRRHPVHGVESEYVGASPVGVDLAYRFAETPDT